jgi:hypothetical protein
MVHLSLAIAATAMELAAQPAQSVCAERESLLANLAREYREAPSALGVTNTGNIIELLRTNDGKTWTLLSTRPDGTSCVVAAGESWEDLPQVAGGQPL